jgi:lysophospholipase L1-like esterase
MRLFIPVALALSLGCSGYSEVKNLSSAGTSVIAFGDSLTAGYGAARGEDWPSRVSSALGLEIINAGVSGDTTDGALARIEDDVLAHDPRIVIVGLGGNDYLRGVPIDTSEANLRAIIKRIQDGGAMVVLLGFRFPSLQVNYEEMYERVAEETGSLLVERVMRGILNDQNLKSDAIHPNARGYALMAERIEKPLRGLIDAANGTR